MIMDSYVSVKAYFQHNDYILIQKKQESGCLHSHTNSCLFVDGMIGSMFDFNPL